MSGEGDSRLERMKRLPMRLRIVHLAALLRWERRGNDLFSSLHRGTRGEGGRREATVGWAKFSKTDSPPSLASASLRTSLPSAARGEGSRDGHAG